MKHFDLYEDNAGNLFLLVYGDKDKVEYFHQYMSDAVPGQVLQDINELKKGADPAEDWDGNQMEDLAAFDHDMEEFFEAFELVEDDKGTYPDAMGCRAFCELMGD